MTGRLRIGVVGCGEIAQIAHLPLLSTMPEFELAAICDHSPALVDLVGERYRVSARFTDHDELVAASGVDAVAVLNSDHAPVVLAAAEAGLHLMVEKPLAFTVGEARAIVEAAASARVALLVGYMRQHDPLYRALRAEVAALGPPRLLRVHDAAGDFTLHSRVHDLIAREDDGKRSLRRASIDERLEAEVGAHAAGLYEAMLMLCTHDAAMLRGLLGPPEEILGCAAIGEEGLVCLLDHGRRGRSVFEGDVGAPLDGWHQHVTARYDTRTVRLELANPYLSQAATTLRFHGSPDPEGPLVGRRQVVADAFRREWRQFHAVVTERAAPIAEGRDAADDVELLAELARRALPAPAPAPGRDARAGAV